jgi:hypothetical protein
LLTKILSNKEKVIGRREIALKNRRERNNNFFLIYFIFYKPLGLEAKPDPSLGSGGQA